MTQQTLHQRIAAMNGTSDTLPFEVNGLSFTIYYDEHPSRGDLGALVPGSVTGDYEVSEGPLIGGKGVVFRQHMSPTGQGSDTKGYAIDRVVEYISTRARHAAPSTRNLDPADLRASVADFRNPATSAEEREHITEWWADNDIPNQFAAMVRAAEIEQSSH